jgi:hypothetical protein
MTAGDWVRIAHAFCNAVWKSQDPRRRTGLGAEDFGIVTGGDTNVAEGTG